MLQGQRKTTSSRQRRTKLRELVNNFKINEVGDMAAEDRQVLRPLVGLLYDADPVKCWRAVVALGEAAHRINDPDPERIRLIIRQQFWAMNDESGDVGWYAPQAIAELCVRVPQLIIEYGHRLVPFFVEEPFEIGAHWGVARIAEFQPKIFIPFRAKLIRSLQETEPAIRYHALRALDMIDGEDAAAAARDLVDDSAEVPVFDIEHGDFEVATVGELARRILTNTN